MPINFSNHTLKDYLNQLSSREPIPGGGSAAAFSAAMGIGLLSMVIQYSIGRKSNTKLVERKLKAFLIKTEKHKKRLLELTSLDSQAYLAVSQARHLDKKAQKKAGRYAAAIPREVCRICYQALDIAPFLVINGNPYLLSDVEVAVELLEAAFNGALVMVKINS